MADWKHAHDLYVSQTYAVDGPRGTGISHYTITLVPDERRTAPRLTVVTRNPAIVQIASAAEGDPAKRFAVTYHTSQRPDGSYCQLLDRLEAV